MSEVRTLNVASQIYGMPVIDPDASMSLGIISDVIVHPTQGKMLGVTLRTIQGEDRALNANDCPCCCQNLSQGSDARSGDQLEKSRPYCGLRSLMHRYFSAIKSEVT